MKYYSATTHKDNPKATGLLTTSLQGKGLAMPIELSGHVDFWSKLRVGLGGALFINTIGKLKHKEHSNATRFYISPQKRPYSLRPFFILGFKFIDNSILSALIDAHLGVEFMHAYTGSKAHFTRRGAKNLGLTLERQISPYFRLFGRLSYDLADDKFRFEEKVISTSKCQSVLLQFGFSINLVSSAGDCDENTTEKSLPEASYPVAKLAARLGKKYEIIESPNCDQRKYRNAEGKRAGETQKPRILVLHYTAGEKPGIIAHFKKKDTISPHYLVDRQGNITRFVPENKRARHVAHGSWRGERDVNAVSIGIYNINLGFRCKPNHSPGTRVRGIPEEWYPYDDELIKTLGSLCKDIIERYNIRPENVIGHSDMSCNHETNHLGRKVDPGPLFPWERIHREHGIGAWYDLTRPLTRVTLPTNKDNKVKWVQTHLKEYGYACPQTGELDEGTKRAIKTFQLHFRPTYVSAAIDEETIQILAQLVDRYISPKAN